jgi:EF hand
MKMHVLTLTTSAVILACGVIAASAQQGPGAEGGGAQQGPATRQIPGGEMQQPSQQQTIRERMRELLQERAQHDEEEDRDRDGYHRYGGGMMGRNFGPGSMHYGSDWRRGQGRPQGAIGLAGPMGRVLFSLMDGDGDGKLSLQEFQAAHERIFKAMDANKDGFVTLEEMQQFIRGARRPDSQQ